MRHFPKSCFGAALVVATFNLVDTPSAAALTMKECSAKYRAAQPAARLEGYHGRRSATPTVVRAATFLLGR